MPPDVDLNRKPELIIFADGSQSACCALVYVLYNTLQGGAVCRLVAGKTRVALARKISVTRMELMGAVAAVRLAKSVENGLQTEWAGRWFFTDSTAALGMIRMASGSFQEFVGT